MNPENLLKEITQVITLNINSDDNNKQNAAHNLDFFFTPYFSSNYSNLFTYYNLYNSMFTTFYADEELKSCAKLIGINSHIEMLESVFSNLYASELSFKYNSSKKIDESVTKERNALINNNLMFCTNVEKSASLSTTDELSS